MADTTATLAPATNLPATMPRRRELLFGTAFAAAGVSMVLLSLIGNYIATRDAGGSRGWLPRRTDGPERSGCPVPTPACC